MPLVYDGKSVLIRVNKEKGITSGSVVYALRKLLGIKKIGHCGTLDPMAEGLLPICVGKTTRFIEYLDEDYKTYRCTMFLGVETDTLDADGKIISKKLENIDVLENLKKSDFEHLLKNFLGHIKQYPPMYSAVHVGGKRLYEYAREGRVVEIPSRNVHIMSIKSLDVSGEEIFLSNGIEIDGEKFTPIPKQIMCFEVRCSKGTYIRSLCRDIGARLGLPATMIKLERSSCGKMQLDGAISSRDIFALLDAKKLSEIDNKRTNCESKSSINLDKIERIRKIEAHYEGIDGYLVKLGKILLDDNGIMKFTNGQAIGKKGFKIIAKPNIDSMYEGCSKFSNKYRVYDFNEETFYGVGKLENGSLRGEKVINEGIQKIRGNKD